MEYLAIFLGALIGLVIRAVIATLWTKRKLGLESVSKTEHESVVQERDEIRGEIVRLNERTASQVERLTLLTEQLEASVTESRSLALELAASKQDHSSKDVTIRELKANHDESRSQILKLEVQFRLAENSRLKSEATLEAATNQVMVLNSQLTKATKLADDYREATDQNGRQLASANAINSSLKEKLETQSKEIEDLQAKMTTVFTNIASKLLDEKSEKFTNQNKAELDGLLSPLKENIADFRKRVDEVYDKESKDRFSLQNEVKQLYALNQQLSKDAENLTKALTTNTRIQGSFGQAILERILEMSGLSKDREYFVQEHIRDNIGRPIQNEENRRMQPDVIVKYPDDRQVIVDSKVSLVDYARAMQSTTKEQETAYTKALVNSIKRHIDDLAGKNYQDHAPALEFVIMFVPMESAYLLAMHADATLWEYAFNKRVLLSSPTNLIVALKMISDLWRRDKQSKNYEAIVEKGGNLYDKFCGVLESIEDIGKGLRMTEKGYYETISRIRDGNGNLLRQVGQLKELGVKTKKILPDRIIEPNLKLASVGGALSSANPSELTRIPHEENDAVE